MNDVRLSNRRWVWARFDSPSRSDAVSVLAIAETACASVLFVWIALNIGTLHLTVSSAIAPFLLLRTKRSTAMGVLCSRHLVSFANAADNAIGRTVPDQKLAGFVVACLFVMPCYAVVFLMAAIGALLIRVFATVAAVIKTPVTSISTAPSNWWRFVARIDSTTNAEIVPGTTGRFSEEDEEFLVPSKLIRKLLGDIGSAHAENWGERLGIGVLLGGLSFVVFVALFLPAFIYRWSLKGSALIYSPLIYIVHGALRSAPETLVSDIRELAIHRLARLYAAIVLLLFVGKLYLFMAWSELSNTWERIPGIHTVNAYVVPEEIAPWHIASIANAVLVWAVFLLADFAVARSRRAKNDVAPSRRVVDTIRILWLIRGVLSIYTIACVFYITAALAPQIDWPPLGSQMFPW